MSKMFVKNLSDVAIEVIIDCFLKAFENYFVKMPTDIDYYVQRWKAAKVDFSLSYGMFDGNKMVGFIIHAIDKRNDVLIAFNTGTGVIPEYRGKKIIRTIYAYALDELRKNGIQKSALEVITENKIAIALYKSIGFTIRKEYKCFNGTIDLNISQLPDLKTVDLKQIDWNSLPNQKYYSWDNQKAPILAGNYSFFQVLHNGQPESFFIINTVLNYVAQMDILISQKDAWKRLFAGIQKVSGTIKINNVAIQLQNKIDALTQFGLKNTVDQFEMELDL
ncbi:GNAT family N-acetyltransferase [Tenacibaculum amylolyticum]|uniref:GNAT family N-acetyltransferase n=1 Tax=Tenacibaculum amylolyticum TaxID=104269 RepID=UPI003894F7E0